MSLSSFFALLAAYCQYKRYKNRFVRAQLSYPGLLLRLHNSISNSGGGSSSYSGSSSGSGGGSSCYSSSI